MQSDAHGSPSLPNSTTPTSDAATGSRLVGIEAGRALAALFVCYVHQPIAGSVGLVLDVISCAAVPYFFVTSGFFFAKPGRSPASVLPAFTRRVLTIYAPWLVFYSVVPLDWFMALVRGELWNGVKAATAASLSTLATQPWNFVLDGPPGGFHLWFLPSLLCAAGIVTAYTRGATATPRGLWILAGTVWLIGLAVKGLSSSELREVAFNPRNGPFQGLLLFLLGWHVRMTNSTPSARAGALLFAAGAGVVLVEASLSGHSPTTTHVGYSAGNWLLGVGAFVLAYRCTAPPLPGVWLGLGELSLPVYLVHLACRNPLSVIAGKLGLNIPWSYVGFAVTFITAIVVVSVIRRFPPLAALSGLASRGKALPDPRRHLRWTSNT